MQSAPHPGNEPERLAALDRYKILDTKSEELFDSVARIAATICDVPIALITLLDSDRQWFKAKVGIEASETARDFAFCAHAILQPDELMIVPDATKDARFHDNPLVLGAPDIRFYAGAPIVTSDHYALGTLCVIDRRPRELSDRQIDALRHLSKQVRANLDLRIRNLQLEQLNESKNRFFSILSHDLRSPLSSVLSIADLLCDPVMSFTDAEVNEFIKHIQVNARTTSQIAENLLRMMQFEQGKFVYNPSSIPLSEIIDFALQAVEGTLVAKQLSTTRQGPDTITVWADSAMLHSIVQNLLSNAVKFTPKGGHISISVTCDSQAGVLRISDTGVGMKPDILQTLGRIEFVHSTTGTDGEKGSGLGLALCRQLACKLGGDLSFASEVNHGTTVTLRIPMPNTVNA